MELIINNKKVFQCLIDESNSVETYLIQAEQECIKFFTETHDNINPLNKTLHGFWHLSKCYFNTLRKSFISEQIDFAELEMKHKINGHEYFIKIVDNKLKLK